MASSSAAINASNKQLTLVVPDPRPPLTPITSATSSSHSNGPLLTPLQHPDALGQPTNIKVNNETKSNTNDSNCSETEESNAEILRRLEEFKNSPYYLAPFEEDLVSLPESQLHFEKKKFPKDLELFKQIAREGVERRGKFGSGVTLIMKYGGKILGNFIRNRQEEMNLPDSKKPKPEFFNYLGDLIQQGIDMSTVIKKEKPYTKHNVESNAFYERVDNLYNYFAQILAHSPFGLYLRWAELQMYKDDPTNPRYGVNVLDEGADLFAQWRAMGYENSTFFGRRIVNMLRLFARSKMPSVDDV